MVLLWYMSKKYGITIVYFYKTNKNKILLWFMCKNMALHCMVHVQNHGITKMPIPKKHIIPGYISIKHRITMVNIWNTWYHHGEHITYKIASKITIVPPWYFRKYIGVPYKCHCIWIGISVIWYMSKKLAIYHGTCQKNGITMVHVQKNMLFTMVHVKNRVLPWCVSKKVRHYHGTCPKMWYYHGSCLNKNNILSWHMVRVQTDVIS